MHENGETRKQRHSKIISFTQLCPEHRHFPSTSARVAMKGSALRNEKYQRVFSGLTDQQRHFRAVAALGWSTAQIGSTNLPRTLQSQGKKYWSCSSATNKILQIFLCHDFSQTKTQSRSYLMIQSQTEIGLARVSHGIIPGSVRQNEEGNGEGGASANWD